MPVAPVRTGSMPIHPHGVLGPMKTSEIRPRPTRTRITRSMGCSVTTRKFLIKSPLEGEAFSTIRRNNGRENLRRRTHCEGPGQRADADPLSYPAEETRRTEGFEAGSLCHLRKSPRCWMKMSQPGSGGITR